MPLMPAAQAGRSMVDCLIARGVDLAGDAGTWALFEAVDHDRGEVVELLASKGIDVNGKNWDFRTF